MSEDWGLPADSSDFGEPVEAEKKKNLLSTLLEGLVGYGKSVVGAPQHAMEAAGTVYGRPALAGEVAKGAGKGASKTLLDIIEGMSGLAEKGGAIAGKLPAFTAPGLMGRATELGAGAVKRLAGAAEEKIGEPQTPAEEVGAKAGESAANVASLFVPMGKASMLERGAETIAKPLTNPSATRGLAGILSKTKLARALEKEEGFPVRDIGGMAKAAGHKGPIKNPQQMEDFIKKYRQEVGGHITSAPEMNVPIDVSDVIRSTAKRMEGRVEAGAGPKSESIYANYLKDIDIKFPKGEATPIQIKKYMDDLTSQIAKAENAGDKTTANILQELQWELGNRFGEAVGPDIAGSTKGADILYSKYLATPEPFKKVGVVPSTARAARKYGGPAALLGGGLGGGYGLTRLLLDQMSGQNK